jgi:ParB-like chromosome segregation protein Spo0J
MIEARSGVEIPDEFGLRLPVARLIVAEWNPNKQSNRTFQRLVKDIREDGFLEAILVVPIVTPEDRAAYIPPALEDGGEFWLIVGGAHRKGAAEVLNMEVVPCVVRKNWTTLKVKFRNMSLNTLKGRIDSRKFLSLYQECLEEGLDSDFVQAEMGLVEKKAFDRLMRDALKDLPPELKKQAGAALADVETVDELSRVLNELLVKHGDQLQHSFLMFSFGGRSHLWVQLDEETLAELDRVQRFAGRRRLNINVVMRVLFSGAEGRLENLPEEVFGDDFVDDLPEF